MSGNHKTPADIYVNANNCICGLFVCYLTLVLSRYIVFSMLLKFVKQKPCQSTRDARMNILKSTKTTHSIWACFIISCVVIIFMTVRPISRVGNKKIWKLNNNDRVWLTKLRTSNMRIYYGIRKLEQQR